MLSVTNVFAEKWRYTSARSFRVEFTTRSTIINTASRLHGVGTLTFATRRRSMDKPAEFECHRCILHRKMACIQYKPARARIPVGLVVMIFEMLQEATSGVLHLVPRTQRI